MTLREERKLQTRQALLDAALRLTGDGRGFAGLSLREIAREAGVVPTAFYRHFSGLDQLGLALVDDVFMTLRQIMRQARQFSSGAIAIESSVHNFLGYVREHRAAFEFMARERLGGPPVIREAVGREVRYFVNDLTSDLRMFSPFTDVPSEDLDMLAELVVHTVLGLTADILELPEGQSRREQELTTRAIKQLRLIFLGAVHWKPERGAVHN